MDPLSISASLAALLHVTKQVIGYLTAAYNAPKEREDLVFSLQGIEIRLNQLDGLVKEAQADPGSDWYQGILELKRIESSRTELAGYVFDPDEKKKTGTVARLKEHVVGPEEKRPNGPMGQLYVLMRKMEQDLTKSDGVDSLKQRAVWRFKRERYESMMSQIARCRSEIDSILSSDHWRLNKDTHSQVVAGNLQMNDGFSNIYGELQTIKDNQRLDLADRKAREDEAERENIKQWLSPLDPLKRQQELVENCFRTEQWLLDTIEFKYWVIGQKWYLRCYGEPGSGKTILSATVIDRLKTMAPAKDAPVICLFLEDKQRKDQTMKNLFGSLLKQLLQISRSTPVKLREAWQMAKEIKAQPSLDTVCKALQSEVEKYDMIYLVVDALDECPIESRHELLARLRELRKTQPQKLSLLITSRRTDGEDRANIVDCDICGAPDFKVYWHCKTCNLDMCKDCRAKRSICRDEAHKFFEPPRIDVDIHTPPLEMRAYVNWEISKEIVGYGESDFDERIRDNPPDSTPFGRKLLKNPQLLERIPPTIVDRAEGKILYASFFINSLRAAHTRQQIQNALDRDPDMTTLYEEAMQRIKNQKDESRDLGLKTLSTIVCAKRLLSVPELLQCLAIEPGDDDFNDENDYDKESILECTLGLINIESDGSNVRLVHSTLQHYLEDNIDKWFSKAELGMAIACLTCLNFRPLSKPCKNDEKLEKRLQEYPFLAYASSHWGDHVREATVDTALCAKALKFCDDENRVAACIEAEWYTNKGVASWDVRGGLEGIHLCAFFGLSSVISALKQENEEDFEVDLKEPTYKQTPLIYACRAGDPAIVEQLLDLGAAVNVHSSRGRTPLIEAVLEDCEEVVDVLLQKRGKEIHVNAVHTKEFDRTALMIAAHLGNTEIVDRLLEHPDISVNYQDAHGSTALSLATTKGYYGIVKALLERSDINVNLVESVGGRSALFMAVRNDSVGIVDLLLQNKADSNIRDYQNGGSAILRAVEHGYTSVLETMIKYNVNLLCFDDDGRGLLHGASTGGWPEIIETLHSEGLSVDMRDNNKMTPLHDACQNGLPEITRTLLDLGADKTTEDRFGRIPRHVAWQYGQKKIMEILDGGTSGALNGNSPDSLPDAEKLPLWSMSKLGLTDQVKLRVARRKSSPSNQDDEDVKEPGSDNSALHLAINAKHIDILRILLEDGNLSPDCVNHDGRTPLHFAAVLGNFEAATLLLQFRADPNLPDRHKITALFLAQSNKHHRVAIALIEAGADLDKNYINVDKMFFEAVKLRSIDAVEILMKKGADMLGRDEEGFTALQIAKSAGDVELTRVLNSLPSVISAARGIGDLPSRAKPVPI